jgi:hypothetical protein
MYTDSGSMKIKIIVLKIGGRLPPIIKDVEAEKDEYVQCTLYKGCPIVGTGFLVDLATSKQKTPFLSLYAETGFLPFKGTVRPDWICMIVVSLESPLKGHQPLYVFNF